MAPGIWMRWVKGFNNFIEKEHQTRLFSFFFGQCKKGQSKLKNMILNTPLTTLKNGLFKTLFYEIPSQAEDEVGFSHLGLDPRSVNFEHD